MYGSYRFYIDRWPKKITASDVLDIFDMLGSALGASFTRIIHTLFSMDNDEPITNVEYTNDTHGREAFISSGIVLLFTSKFGEQFDSFFTATCNVAANKLYDCIYINVRLPFSSNPLIISIDYDNNYVSKDINFSRFIYIHNRLNDMGYRVNNAFHCKYHRKNTAACFDGGQIGSIVPLKEKRWIRRSVAHRQKRCTNCMIDLFEENSVLRDTLSDAAKEEIKNVVGDSSVSELAESFIFSIPTNSSSIISDYSPRKKSKIKKILLSEGVLTF